MSDEHDQDLTAVPADAEELRVGDARRQATVVFSDLSGYTALSEPLPPRIDRATLEVA